MIDFHSHILPSIDDGSKDIEMSCQMIEEEFNSGVKAVCLTPHFYLERESFDTFIEKRKKSFAKLCKALKDKNSPYLFLGAEVLFTPLLAGCNLKQLCIGQTDYMLLELPYKKLSPSFLSELRRFIDNADVKIIIAHIERYLKFTDEKSIREVMSMDVISQVNTSSFLKMSLLRNKLIKWIDSDMVHLLGSDAHNLTSRPVNMKDAYNYIQSKVSDNKLMKNAALVLQNEDII